LDLAAYALVPELIRAGVGALKIEGRLKSPEYVAAVTQHYRRAIDAAMAGQDPHYSPDEIRQLEAAFSRGFSHGWLEGDNHKRLVTAAGSANRGVRLGIVRRVLQGRVEVELTSPVKRGDGIAFAADRAEQEDQGGRVYAVYVRGRPVTEPVAGGLVELAFARGAIEWSKVQSGQIVWKTDDPELQRRLRKTYGGPKPARRVPLDLVVEASVGRPLRIRGQAGSAASCEVESPEALEEALKHPLGETLLREQLGRLGETPYHLRRLEVRLAGRPMIPLSVLGRLRREMIAQLDASVASRPRAIVAEPQLARLRAAIPGPEAQGHGAQPSSVLPEHSTAEDGCAASPTHPGETVAHVLCRSPDQLDAALGLGVRSVIVEYRDIAAYGEAVRTAHRFQAEILLATPRIQRPGETWVFDAIARHEPGGVLARNLAALGFFHGRGLPVVADFSLNAANDLAVQWLCDQGARRVTACLDLNRSQLLDLAAAVPPARLEVVIHLHVPMFHTEHCLLCANLSAGTSRTDCGQPCERHAVRLEDRKGGRHLVACDGLCRNTVYQAVPQSAAETVPLLAARGVRHFRIELLNEQGPPQTRRILEIYQELLAGRMSGREAWLKLRTTSPDGVTRGTMR
jgi:putative protease